MKRIGPLLRGLPLLPVAPAIVLVVGLATAAAIVFLGRAQFQRTSDEAADLRARVLAATVAARVRGASPEARHELIGAAARRSGTELLLVAHDGRVLVNESLVSPRARDVAAYLAAGRGLAETPVGRTRFATSALPPPLDALTVIAFVPAAAPPAESQVLIQAVAALAALLLGVAAAVAFGFAKATRDDVDDVRERIVEMAGTGPEPTGRPIAFRALDQLGVLVNAFNVLVTRFAAAERTYRADLARSTEIDREGAEFLAGVSHELRTPLNAILGFAHVLESEVDGPLGEDARENVLIIRSSGEHLRLLIDDILDLSAMETGQLKLARAPVRLEPVAEEVLKEAFPGTRGKPVSLLLTGDPDIAAHADARRVRQILSNLVGNAVKFTAEGRVEVRLERRGGLVAVVIRDTGPGIAPGEVTAIFEEYRQAGDVASRRGGTGLGLAIARRLARMHGGDIEVTSALGRGSTFTLTLPAAPSPSAAQAPARRDAAPTTRARAGEGEA